MPPFSGRYTCGRYLQALAVNNNDSLSAIGYAEAQNWADKHQIVAALKSAQSPISTTDFPGALTPIGDSFLAAMADVSIPLRLQGLRRTPMLTRVYINSQGVVATRVAEGAPTPVLAWRLERDDVDAGRNLPPLPWQTDELACSCVRPLHHWRLSDDLARATAVAGKRRIPRMPDIPGSVLYGQTGFNAAGSSLANIDSDLKLLIAAVRGASDPNATFIMSKGTASYLGTLRGTGGAAAYPERWAESGGRLLGLQVLISSAAEDADSPSSQIIALLSPSEILWADEGRVTLMTSNRRVAANERHAVGVSDAAQFRCGRATPRRTKAVRECVVVCAGRRRCILSCGVLRPRRWQTFDPEKMADDVVTAARDFVKRATDALGKRTDELEHRATRHAEHLARLETRIAALERKADK